MPPITTEPTLLESLHERRAAKVTAWAAFIDAREAVETAFEARMTSDSRPSEDEVRAHEDARVTYRASADQLESEIRDFDKRIADLAETERRRNEAADAHKGNVDVTHEPLLYNREAAKGQGGISYYRDLAAALVPGLTLMSTDQSRSMERLIRHAQQMDVEMPKRAKSRERRALAQVTEAEARGGRTLQANPFEYRAEPNRTDGQGGYFVPPLWLEDEYIPQLVAHMVAAGLCHQMDLPPGTDSINIPKVKTGTAVGYQVADNSGVLSQDWTDSAVQANVKTIAGESDVALQLLEQSPHGLVDEVITMNLMQQYNAFKDQQVLAGDGLNSGQLATGHIKGLYPASNWTASGVTWTDATPSGQHFISVLAAMASQIARQRYDLSSLKFVMHGRRYFWYAASLDVNGRPLVEAADMGPWNIAAEDGMPRVPEGLAGRTNFGAPIYIDDNVQTTVTTTHDVVYAANWDDVWTFEGDLRTNVYREVLSGSLGVRFQIYNYFAMLVRYGQSVALATGTGLVTPKGAVSTIVY